MTNKNVGLPTRQDIKSTFPNRKMTLTDIMAYTKNYGTLTILSTYAETSRFDLELACSVRRVWSCDKNGKPNNEYGGNYNEYWVIDYDSL